MYLWRPKWGDTQDTLSAHGIWTLSLTVQGAQIQSIYGFCMRNVNLSLGVPTPPNYPLRYLNSHLIKGQKALNIGTLGGVLVILHFWYLDPKGRGSLSFVAQEPPVQTVQLRQLHEAGGAQHLKDQKAL